ncbi:MAG TPA: site-specific integrase [Mycobacterium sp.]
MSGTRPDESRARNDAVGGYRPEVLQALWESIPTGMRLTCFSPDTVPREYRGGLGEKRGRSTALDLSAVPEPIRTELAWCVFRIIDQGGRVDIGHMRMLARRLSDVISDLGPGAPTSLIGLSVRDWEHQMTRSRQRRAGALPAPGTARDLSQQLRRCYRLLSVAYDPRPWWRLEVWDPSIDSRIPQRLHEPHGRLACYFDRIATGWLRRGLQWSCKVGLETGALAWGTVKHRIEAAVVFDAFLGGRDLPGPWLADGPAEVRSLLLDFLGHVRGLRVQHPGPTHGQPLSQSRVSSLLNGVEQFYLFMHDQRETAAASLAEPGWLRLGPEHAMFFRRGEKPRRSRHRSHERDVIDADAFAQIMAGTGLLGTPTADGGLGDEQAMRILMLLARTGRRVSEICMLDHDPLLPLHQPGTGTADDADGFVARLRYQQTKIDGAPDTILVDREIVAIIHAQQDWARRARTEPDTPTRKYLFVAGRKNRHGDRPYSDRWLRERVGELVLRLDIRDSTGALVDFQRTHRFRHTKPTTLLNAGVPLHVVQRYLGHVTPAMTMIYAQTLQSTAEAEFLRYRKITADARDLEIDPQDLYDMLELDRRSDRILPNGWCLLPPRQSCVKGNACLSCDKFATDATFLPDLKDQMARTEQLIDQRCSAFQARTGQRMSEDNVWLAGRRQEHDALGRIIINLEQVRLADGTVRALRGAGVAAPVESTIDNKVN